jgi:protoporphyrinogen IX oxidase
MSFMIAAYPWIKALHIISVIAWMAGLLYLPRLFVYHAAAPIGSPAAETFKIMERKLARMIMLPAMIATLFFGLMLAGIPGLVDWKMGWIHGKLLLVVLLLVFQHFLSMWRRDFERDTNQRSAKFFRMVNELPALAMALIVILVVVKPF